MKIRAYEETDQSFVVGLALRFMDFELMSWRDPKKMAEAQLRIAQESIQSPSPGTEIFVAEDEKGERLGFLEVGPHHDKLNDTEQGSIVAIAVSPQGEGQGVGTRLMAKAEEWAKEKGYGQLILHVFHGNHRAVGLYKHLGYEIEVAKMVKEL
ncbi:GNAT family N-acetyltransferase [Paenibacillus tyrfis]|uniref:GNAT family N-acetyltransferase n=1 Tax=Paenibacillus tyrfis TaxID=1501230 RepID=UPI000B596D41|nr:GNAT family N-acetyltransferase [Paenibacillus tyrfis]